MGNAIELQALLFGTMSGAAIVLTGALYALFFALGRLHNNRSLALAGLAAYACLFAATIVLVRSLSLSGIWLGVAAVMVIGYFFAPRAIWQLCIGTHGKPSADVQRRATNE